MRSTPHFRGLAPAIAALALLSGVTTGARAQAASAPGAAPPSGVLNLAASAETEVPKDLMTLVMGTSREGADAATVQGQLKQALDAALNEARKAAKPGQLEVRTGQFAVFPRYGNKGAITGWQGSTELVLEGRDMPAIAQLSGRLGTMTIQRVAYGLSREAREKVEGEVTAQAIARYRAKAAEMARQFGYGSVTVREVNVSTNDQMGGGPVPMFERAKMAAADVALPVEPGKGVVSATVTGTVQMRDK
jgi:predicted secreted protein